MSIGCVVVSIGIVASGFGWVANKQTIIIITILVKIKVPIVIVIRISNLTTLLLVSSWFGACVSVCVGAFVCARKCTTQTYDYTLD